MEKLAQILERKPSLKLNPMERTAVNTRTKDEYWTLMRVYETGRWTWKGGNLPREYDAFSKYGRETCVSAGVNFFGANINDKGKFECAKISFYLRSRWNVISYSEFYLKQNIKESSLFMI